MVNGFPLGQVPGDIRGGPRETMVTGGIRTRRSKVIYSARIGQSSSVQVVVVVECKLIKIQVDWLGGTLGCWSLVGG